MPDSPDATPAKIDADAAKTDQTDPSAPILLSGAHDSLDRATAANDQAARDAAPGAPASAPPRQRARQPQGPGGNQVVYNPATMKAAQPLWQTLVLAFFILLTLGAGVLAAIQWTVVNPREASSTADYLAFSSHKEEVARLLRDEQMRRDVGDYTEAKAYASKAFDVYAQAEKTADAFLRKYDPNEVAFYSAVETELAELRATMAEVRRWYEVEYPKRVFEDDTGLPNSGMPGDDNATGDNTE